MGVPQNGRFLMENPMKMDDLGIPLFQETSMLYCDVSNVPRYIMKHAAYADSSLSIPFQPWRSIPKGSSILGDIYSCKKNAYKIISFGE